MFFIRWLLGEKKWDLSAQRRSFFLDRSFIEKEEAPTEVTPLEKEEAPTKVTPLEKEEAPTEVTLLEKEEASTKVTPLEETEVKEEEDSILVSLEGSETGRVIMPAKKLDRLGGVLLRYNMITYANLRWALSIQSQSKPRKFLGEILIEEKMLTEEKLVSALSRQFKIPYIKIDKYGITKDVIKLIPEETAKRLLVFPINKMGQVLVVAMVNPANLEAMKELKKLTGCKIKPVLAKLSEIKEAVKDVYARGAPSPPAPVTTKEVQEPKAFSQTPAPVSEIPFSDPPTEQEKTKESVQTSSTPASGIPPKVPGPVPQAESAQPSKTDQEVTTPQPKIIPMSDEEFAAGLRSLTAKFEPAWEQKYQRDKISKAQEVSEAEFDFFRSL